VAAFMLDAEAACRELQGALGAGTWRPAPPRRIWLRDPKPRLISALPFRDRVVQHLLIEATLPALEHSFAPQSCACRTEGHIVVEARAPDHPVRGVPPDATRPQAPGGRRVLQARGAGPAACRDGRSGPHAPDDGTARTPGRIYVATDRPRSIL
jgi:hypothetical protein